MDKVRRGAIFVEWPAVQKPHCSVVIDSTDFETYILEKSKIVPLSSHCSKHSIYNIKTIPQEKIDLILKEVIKRWEESKLISSIKFLFEGSNSFVIDFLKSLMTEYTMEVQKWNSSASIESVIDYMKRNQNYFEEVLNET